jgi:diadenosine tetraphosphate (Ap4A) HIT family hydrolase
MYRTRKDTKHYKPAEKRKLHFEGNHCPFCSLEPLEVIKTGATMLMISNKYPYHYWEFMDVTDHLMIIPKRHVTTIASFTQAEKLEFLELLSTYERLGYNVYARAEENIMKTIPHQHTHLIKTKAKMAKIAVFTKQPYFVWKR